MSKPAPPSRAGVKKPSVIIASCSYQAQTPGELSFEEGDSIIVLEMTDKFWKCKIGQKEGNVPSKVLIEDTAIENALHDASKRGNVDLIKELLNQGASANGKLFYRSSCVTYTLSFVNLLGLDKAGNTPLHWAARSKHIDAVQVLLAKSPLINAQNKMGDTPLHSACWGGSLEVVKVIVEVSGVKLDIRNKNKELPLDLAKNDEIAAFLIQYIGLKTNVKDLEDED